MVHRSRPEEMLPPKSGGLPPSHHFHPRTATSLPVTRIASRDTVSVGSPPKYITEDGSRFIQLMSALDGCGQSTFDEKLYSIEYSNTGECIAIE